MPDRNFFQERMKSHRSGALGEAFCRREFGITEPHYEIKSNGHSRSMVVAQACQLFESLGKQYVIVRYHRSMHTAKKGEHKGRRIYDDTIEVAYQKKLDVYVVQGHVLLQIVIAKKLPLWCTARNKNLFEYGKWGLVYRINLSDLPVEKMQENERYNLWYDPMYPPGWMAPNLQKEGYFDFSKEDKPEREPGEDAKELKPLESEKEIYDSDTPF